MGEMDSSIKEVALWKSVEDGTVVKTIDSTFQQSGESVVPMEFIDFFAATDMKKGDSQESSMDLIMNRNTKVFSQKQTSADKLRFRLRIFY